VTRSWQAWAAAAVLVILTTTACSAAHSAVGLGPADSTLPSRVIDDAPAPDGSAANGSALAELATLAVNGRAPMTGYSRDQFGPAWTDDDDDTFGHNGCDTRNDILRRDLTSTTIKPNSNGCVVLSGTLADPYTGKTIDFTRGEDTSTAVEIDHVVALGDAWQMGAQQLSVRQRQNLANDPLNLLAVDGPTNLSKGDSDAASWLPPNKAERCPYVARQIAVKAKYGLAVTSAERDEITRILGGCPGQSVSQ
jgi:Protein of unknown function (DUF1524)